MPSLSYIRFPHNMNLSLVLGPFVGFCASVLWFDHFFMSFISKAKIRQVRRLVFFSQWVEHSKSKDQSISAGCFALDFIGRSKQVADGVIYSWGCFQAGEVSVSYVNRKCFSLWLVSLRGQF